MNYYQPRRREDNGLWHYTCRNDDEIWPVGDCGAYRDCPDCHGESFYTVTDCATCENKGVIRLPPEERCPGHDTPEGARAHAAEHVVQATKLDRVSTLSDWSGCDHPDCDVPTKQAITLAHPDHRLVSLCDAHLNRDSVQILVGDELGDIVSS